MAYILDNTFFKKSINYLIINLNPRFSNLNFRVKDGDSFEKILSKLKISKDEKLRKLIAKKGRDKYHKYFNSNIVSEFIVNKTLEINHNKNKYLWHRP